MTEKPIPSKSEEERRKEAEKLRAEAERSLEAAKVKMYHGLIESITKRRKLPLLLSLWERIDLHLGGLKALIEWLRSNEQASLTFSFEEVNLVQKLIKTHESIRRDFKEVVAMDDKKLDELFPKITTYFERRTHAITVVAKIMEQEADMKRYSYRMIG